MILDDNRSERRSTASTSATIEPFAVPILEAARLLGRGRKARGGRSSICELLARGELDAVKDGRLTLVTMASIRRLHASRPPAVFKQPVKRARS
jgi:hypothetical protein